MISRFALAASVTTCLLTLSLSANAGTVTVEQHGGRSVRVFVPTKVASPTPMVVMLHGCTQTPDAFADGTQMDVLAEKEGFVVAYPEQPSSTIPTRCFQWFTPAHQARGAGEPKELADAATGVASAHGVDVERIYVAGISAGAAMSVILGATYPDVFTAIGVFAGVEYKAGTTVAEGLSASQNGGPDPEAQGMLAFTAMGSRARALPTFVMHGTSDGVVSKTNGDQVALQWRRTNTLVLGEGSIDDVKSATGTAGYPFTRMVHASKVSGASIIEYYVVDGLGHAWPGGKEGGSYTDVRGPDGSTLVWGFFKGRTRSKPLDVAPVVIPGSDGGIPATPDAGGTTTPGGTRDHAGAAASDGGDSGCTFAPSRARPAIPLLALVSLLTLGLMRSRRGRLR